MRSRRPDTSRHDNNHGQTQRHRIAEAAARLISEHGIRDYHQAKRKAAAQLGLDDETGLPKNSEIEAALREYQRLFQSEDQPRLLHRLRKSACEAMRFFAAFEPRLVGAVLDGSADRYSAICLHLFSDEIEAVERFLDEHGIPCEQQARQLRLTRESQQEFPVFLFSADSIPIDITVLERNRIRQAPLNRIDGKTMQRASLATLERLLADETSEQAQRLLSGT